MTNTHKPTETAVFDKKLFLWTDGTTKLNRCMGLWNAHLYQLKATEYNDLMENYGLEDECMTVDEMN